MFIHLVTMWQGSWDGAAAPCMKFEFVIPQLCQLDVAHISFLAVNALGSHYLHHSDVYIWVYMAIYSNIHAV